ncbi:MAG: methyltransferase domain-containing protein [Gemmatimonadales bacterium]|nr:MAG: methyltransferase domain-containing protein [Gemmatimonadales bacterium]
MEIRDLVKERYGRAARAVTGEGSASCCGPEGCGPAGPGPEGVGPAGSGCDDPITSNLYDEVTTLGLPEETVRASLGCGNPTALANLHEGEVVLDLGSGGGIDVLLSARRVGPSGKAYGLDMTPEMLELARRNAATAGASNVEFLEGEMESIPLPDASVDVIISNCVINLAAEKEPVLREAFRVLRPGGRFAVSDVVTRGEIPAAIRRSMELWVGCVAGALDESDFLALLHRVGFEDPSIEPTRVYEPMEAATFLREAGFDPEELAREVEGRFMAAFVRARKPL